MGLGRKFWRMHCILYEQRKATEYSSVVPCCNEAECITKNIPFSVGKYEGWICKIPKIESVKDKRKQIRKRKAKHDVAEEKRKKKKRKIPED
jgi:hypothetical protein